MNIDAFKGLAADAAVQQAADLAGVPAHVISGIWRTESANGSQMVSPAGARGHVGIMPATLAELSRRAGRAVDPDDLGDAMWAAGTLMKENLRKWGTIPDALRAYNSGWRPEKWDNPETNAYVPKVLGTADGGLDTVRTAAYERGARRLALNLPEFPLNQNTQGTTLTALADAAFAAEQKYADISFGDQTTAAFMQQGLTSVIGVNAAAPDFTPTPDFEHAPNKLQGLTTDELTRAYAARSDAELDHTLTLIDLDRQDTAKLGAKGIPRALAASFVAGLPEAILTGRLFSAPAVALYRASRLTDTALAARQALGGGTLGVSIASNVGGNLVATGLEDAFTERVHALDYAMAVPMGLIGTLAELRGIMSAERLATAKGSALAEMDNIANQRGDIEAQAVLSFNGQAHTKEELDAAIGRITGERMAAALTPLRKTFGDDFDAILERETAAEAAAPRVQADAPAGAPAALADQAALVDFGSFIKERDSQASSALARSWDHEYSASADAWWDRHVKPLIPGDASKFQRVEVLRRSLAGEGGVVIVNDKVAPEAAHMVEWLQRQWLPNHVIALGVETQGNFRGSAATLGPRTAIIALRGSSPKTAAHEVGHIILNTITASMSRKGRAYAEAAEGLRTAYSDWLGSYVKRGPGANAAIASTYAKSGVTDYTAAALQNATDGVVSGMLLSGWGAAAQSDAKFRSYTGNFDEWGAESFARFILEGLNSKHPGLNLKPDRKLLAFIQEWYDGAVAVFRELLATFKEVTGATIDTDAHLPVDERVQKFFNMARKFAQAEDTKLARVANDLPEYRDGGPVVNREVVREGHTRLYFAPVGDATNPPLGHRSRQDAEAWYGVAPGKAGLSYVDVPSHVTDASIALTPEQIGAGRPVSEVVDKFYKDWGLDLLPTRTAQQRAEVKWLESVFREAVDPNAVWNNVDPRRMSILAQSSTFGSNGLRMLSSEHPVLRMVASKLLETTTGAGGRAPSASVAHWQYERRILGNTSRVFQRHYAEYSARNNGNWREDISNGRVWADFNTKVAEVIESRRTGADIGDVDPAVLKAAAEIERMYGRSRDVQVASKVTGWAALPPTSRGYMPHLADGQKLASASLDQQRVFVNAMSDSFQALGWDTEFSNHLAIKYLDRVKRRALGQGDTPTGRHATGAAAVVEDALVAMGLTASEVREHMARYTRAAAGHLQHRIDLDLLQRYTDADGKTFRLLDFFRTDQLQMAQVQTRRVAGEAALADFGVMGRAGLNLIRSALITGPKPADAAHLADFEQVAAEFLGDPFGNHVGGRTLDRVMQMNSLVRLGGLVWTQLAETVATATTLGVGHMMRAVASFPRLIGEARALSRGDVVKNPILGSIEDTYGYTHGTDGYNMVFPFDAFGYEHGVAGVDKPEMVDRLLRGGSLAQAKFTGYRALHAAQIRAVSEQIVHKALRRIKQTGIGGSREALGFDSKSLIDMGIDPQVASAIRDSLPFAAVFDGDKLVSFDITKIADTQAAYAFSQAILRGSHQIIQGRFIGEGGAWVHNDWLRLLTQFRTFGITATEKQWTRQRANHGDLQMLGIMIGSMSAVLPVYIARMYANSVGREDSEAYLERQLRPEHMAVAVLNYVGWSGLAPDVVQAMSAAAGTLAKEDTMLGNFAAAISTAGGRTGQEQGLVGSTIAPAAGLVDQAYKQLQDTREGTNWHGVLDLMPFSKAPGLMQLFNTMRPEPAQ